MSVLSVSLINNYLAHKQHLPPAARLPDVLQVTRDIGALHSTLVAAPYLSAWARVRDFERRLLDNALYGEHTLARLLCMRQTLHVVPADEISFFFQAYSDHYVPEFRRMCQGLLVQGGLCQAHEAAHLLEALQQSVLAVVGREAATVQEISRDLPLLRTKVIYSVGRPYLGELSIGSRLVPGMCVLGLLVRARPRGSWQSNLYEYAALSSWLPAVNLESTTTAEARAWLVRRYLSAFGPATIADIQWWTGFSKVETLQALSAVGPEEVAVEWCKAGHLMLSDDAQRLRTFAVADAASVFLLPALDPYIMGYHDRLRFLAAEHVDKVFDRAGNAIPTVWADGRVAGVWGQKPDGRVVWRLFAQISPPEHAVLAQEAARLESFLAGEVIAARMTTAFARGMGSWRALHR